VSARRGLSRRALLAGVGSTWLLPGVAIAAEGGIDDLLARIAKARSPVRTMKGPFTQTRTIGLLTTDVRSRGSLSLVRPDRLRWELAPPDDVTFWIGPEGLAYRDAHGQGRLAAGTTRAADALQDLRALLGGDLAKLEERWVLRVLSDDTKGAELEATARTAPAEGTRSMRLALATDLVRPTRALLVEGSRDRTVIEFGELTINASIDDRTMRLPA
jgi:outer membrane lipoprotein-sorting protein